MHVEGQPIRESQARTSSHPFLVTDSQLATLAGLIFGADALSLLLSHHIHGTYVVAEVLFQVGLLLFLTLGFRVAWWLLFVRLLIGAFSDADAVTRGHAVSGTALLLLDLAAIATLWRIWKPRLWTIV